MDEWAVVLNGRVIKRFNIDEGQVLTIGRGQESDIVVDNTAISRQHCSLELINGEYYITDLYSLNGTRVNDDKVISAVPFMKTDHVQMGKFTLRPSETLLAERTVESYAVDGGEDLDQTVFVNSEQRKQQSKPGHYFLSVIEGKATPKKLSLAGKDTLKVGKNSSCDMIIYGLFISKTQFFITKREGNLFIIPQSGLVKTRLNGSTLKTESKLKLGDTIKVGSTAIRLE